jgi:hypothetical protein
MEGCLCASKCLDAAIVDRRQVVLKVAERARDREGSHSK